MRKNRKNDDTTMVDNTETTFETETFGTNRFKTKQGMHSLKIRLFATIFLLVFLILFIVLGALYTVLIERQNSAVFSYLSIALTIIILSYCLFEMNKAMGFSKWYFQTLFILFGNLIYIFPTSISLYNFSFYQEMNLPSWFATWQLPVIICIILCFYFGLTFVDKSISKMNALINFSISIIIIFGLKGFTITVLALWPPFIGESDPISARFSFNTIIWIWLMVIMSDSFAYIGGMMYGKTKLAPKISPKKTWEGAIIGLSIATIFGIAYALILNFTAPDFKPLKEPMNVIQSKSNAIQILLYVLLSIVFPIISLFGDLLFSWTKRQAKIKDFSKLIPGHGGALDRLDSILFALFILFIFVSSTSSI